MFVVRFANLSLALSHEPSSDCVIARAKGTVRAQASYGSITVLSLFKMRAEQSRSQGVSSYRPLDERPWERGREQNCPSWNSRHIILKISWQASKK